MHWEQFSLDNLGSQTRRPAPDVCSGKILTLIRHLNATGKLLELDQSLERNPVHICLTELFFTILCMLLVLYQELLLINISEREWAGNVMNYLHMEPENTASQSTQTQACYATIFSKNQALWLGTRFWTSFNWMDTSSRHATNGCLMYPTSLKLAWVGYSSIVELQKRSSTQSSLFARYQGSDCQLSAQTQ